MEVTTSTASPGASSNAAAPVAPASGQQQQPMASPSGETAPQSSEIKREPGETPEEFSARFASLAKRERELTKARTALKEQQRLVENYQKALESARTNPLQLLEAHGLSFDDVTQYILNDGKLTDSQRLAMLEDQIRADKEARDKAERDKADADAKAAQERSKDEYEAVINEHRQAIAQFVESADGEAFDLVRGYGDEAIDLVQTLVQEYYEAHGTILPVSEAVRHVDAHIASEIEKKALTSKRFQTAAPSQNAGLPTNNSSLAPTLTNRNVAATPSESGAYLSDEESKRRAADMLRRRV